MNITNREIEWAERLLLPDGYHFNEERRAFIRCAESCDVVACPGSGKTTALLAKLLILATRMPFSDGRGVCVLTHTNIAIDQIKERAGAVSAVLFRHPNFFGTIQELANRFLAIPAYVARFGQRYVRMDEDVYKDRARQAFFDYDLEKNGAIYTQLKPQIENLPWLEQRPKKLDFFGDLQFRFDGDLVHYVRGDTGKLILRGDRNSTSYKDIHAAKYGLLEKGFLRYQDAFPLALWYLKENPSLSEAFLQRFAFVFVDEAQDTNADQFDMLHAAFPDCSDTVIQYLGDPNQAIYNFHVRKEVDWKPRAQPLPFSDTLRYGSSIAKILSTVRVDDQISLEPNVARKSLPPHLLVFEEGEETQVLPAFARLLRHHVLSPLADGERLVFKAVGWVGRDGTDEGKLCLPSYWLEYRRATRGRKHFSNLLSYLHHAEQTQVDILGSRVYREAVLRGMAQGLTVAGIRHPESDRPFTPHSFLEWLREDDEDLYTRLRTMMSRWTLSLERRDKAVTQIRDEIAQHLINTWHPNASSHLEEFLTSGSVEFSKLQEKPSNVFRDGTIEIEVGTVHSVKGQTHTATLFLETEYYGKTDSRRLLPFLEGGYPEDKLAKARHIENLKVAHVAFSRPTHLLGFACAKAHIAGHEEALAANGWAIHEVASLVKRQDGLNTGFDTVTGHSGSGG